jgi:hypothetical protein
MKARSFRDTIMAKSKTIIVKLRRQPRDVAARMNRIFRLVGPDSVSEARPLFPDEKEEDLASLYEVTLNRSASVDEALASLKQAADVEYAHTPKERRVADLDG